jgi:hypothetical protein
MRSAANEEPAAALIVLDVDSGPSHVRNRSLAEIQTQTPPEFAAHFERAIFQATCAADMQLRKSDLQGEAQ